jgi:glycerophosphoryl diester phosphodiesterase
MALVVLSGKGHRRILMSMYTHILEAALGERPLPAVAPTTAGALAALLRCHARLGSTGSLERTMDWSSLALANQVAYDIALIDLARCLGIDCDPATFDQPERERNELKRALESHGILLDELAQQTEYALGWR